MAHLLNRLKLKQLTKVSVRYKNGPDHWSSIRKKKMPKDRALAHFDEFYASVYRNAWLDIRTALLETENKYVAVVNNFSDTEKIKSDLELQGAMNLKTIYQIFKQDLEESRQLKKEKKSKARTNLDKQISSVLSNTESSEVQSVYPSDIERVPKRLQDENDTVTDRNKALQPIELKSIEPTLNEVDTDTSRIINSSVNLSALYEYVPATKLKGMDDWVLESDYYKHYTKGADFEIKVKKEKTLSFPEHLHVYTFESSSENRFKSPKIGSTGVSNYYLFDGGSVLPILALDLQPGDTVLDMCAAPGGKTLTILQTLLPGLIVANDISQSRVMRIKRIIKEYVGNISTWEDKLFVTEQDARTIEDKNVYNKILVDVPCTTDRHVLHTDDNNLFKPTRVKERLKIPEVQTEILTNALKLVVPGGTVVYSTCSLSPVQNDGVVQMALKKAWEETDSTMIVKDLSKAFQPLHCLYKFATVESKYGNLLVPTLENNWGPMYVCKIVRIR